MHLAAKAVCYNCILSITGDGMTAEASFVESVRDAVAMVEKKIYDSEEAAVSAYIGLLNALTPGRNTDALLSYCGGAVSYEALARLVPPFHLKTMLRLFQRWSDEGIQYRPEAIGLVWGDTEVRGGALMARLRDDGVFTREPKEMNGKTYQVLDFPAAPQVLGRGEVRKAAGQYKAVQYRRHGSDEQLIGWVIDTVSRHHIRLFCIASDGVRNIPYGAIVLDGVLPAQDLIRKACDKHAADGLPLAVVPVSGFEKDGEPEIRIMGDGSYEIVFNFMPPLFAEQWGSSFDAFDAKLAAKLACEVEWADREVFRIAEPGPETLWKALDYLSNYHVIRGGGLPSRWVDSDL